MEQAEGVENKTWEHVERMKAKTRMQMGGVKDKTLIKLGKEAKQNSNSTRTAKLTWPRTKIPRECIKFQRDAKFFIGVQAAS